MMHPARILLSSCFICLPALCAAEELAYRGGGLDLSYVADDPAQTTLAGFGSAELHFAGRAGFQGDIGFEYIAADSEDQVAALLALHPYLRLWRDLALGAYFQGRAADESATAAGLELAWKPDAGFTAELYFGQTWGDELEKDGHATSKGATLGYVFANDFYATLFFNKDTTSESGRPDRDYYDYGLGMELPVGADGDTRLTAEIGQIRFDAEGGSEAKLTLGLTRRFGGSLDRPTFTRQRSVLTGLAGY